jgi:hypothetical protein
MVDSYCIFKVIMWGAAPAIAVWSAVMFVATIRASAERDLVGASGTQWQKIEDSIIDNTLLEGVEMHRVCLEFGPL